MFQLCHLNLEGIEYLHMQIFCSVYELLQNYRPTLESLRFQPCTLAMTYQGGREKEREGGREGEREGGGGKEREREERREGGREGEFKFAYAMVKPKGHTTPSPISKEDVQTTLTQVTL